MALCHANQGEASCLFIIENGALFWSTVESLISILTQFERVTAEVSAEGITSHLTGSVYFRLRKLFQLVIQRKKHPFNPTEDAEIEKMLMAICHSLDEALEVKLAPTTAEFVSLYFCPSMLNNNLDGELLAEYNLGIQQAKDCLRSLQADEPVVASQPTAAPLRTTTNSSIFTRLRCRVRLGSRVCSLRVRSSRETS